MRNNKYLGNLILLLTAFIWGMSFAFQKEGVSAIPPFTFGAARCLLSAIAVSIVAIIMKPKRDVIKPSIRAGIVCGIFLTIATNLQQIGLVQTSAGKGAFITALYMLIIPLIGVAFLKQKIGVQSWIAVALGVLGMYLLCMSESFSLGSGDIYVIGCAIFFALQMIAVDKYTEKCDPLVMSATQFWVNTIVSALIALLFEPATDPAIFKSVAVNIIYCGIFSGGLGYTLQMIGQKMSDPTTAGLILSLESVFGAIGGAIMLSERMQGRELAGAVIMFIAIILVQIPIKNKSK